MPKEGEKKRNVVVLGVTPSVFFKKEKWARNKGFPLTISISTRGKGRRRRKIGNGAQKECNPVEGNKKNTRVAIFHNHNNGADNEDWRRVESVGAKSEKKCPCREIQIYRNTAPSRKMGKWIYATRKKEKRERKRKKRRTKPNSFAPRI